MQQKSVPVRHARFRLAWAVLFLASAHHALASEPYVLSVSDKISVKVVEWKASASTFSELTALGGEYTIGADGLASFPFIGTEQGAGKTTAELAATLSTELQQSLGLTVAPDVTVEIAAYGPIYVTGDINTPGEYPFAPGLTVVKALSLAGGERRTADAAQRAEREVLTTSGTLDVLRDEHMRLLVRRARLDAELAGDEAVTLPPELQDQASATGLVSAENAILHARQRQLSAQTTSLNEEIALLLREIETFEQKRIAMQRQLERAQEQLDKINALSEDGLALASRVTSLETNVSDLEGRLLDIDTASLQARQDIATAERELAELADVRTSELSLERQTADGEIAALALRIANQEALLGEAALYAGVELSAREQQPSYSYQIIRGSEEIPAELGTPVQTGDVVVARLELAPRP
jgi:exopolysaccharide production protein ExoF